jgi:hypothetical protein
MERAFRFYSVLWYAVFSTRGTSQTSSSLFFSPMNLLVSSCLTVGLIVVKLKKSIALSDQLSSFVSPTVKVELFSLSISLIITLEKESESFATSPARLQCSRSHILTSPAKFMRILAQASSSCTIS